MRVQLHSTTKIVVLNGIPARIWEGTTTSGIRIHAFISRIAIDKDEPDASEFERELQECTPPSGSVDASYPLSLVL